MGKERAQDRVLQSIARRPQRVSFQLRLCTWQLLLLLVCLQASNEAMAAHTQGNMLAVGWQHTCAVAAGDVAVCWGSNDRGQLGLGHSRDTSSPGAVVDLGPSLAVASVHASVGSSCAVFSDGRCKCWGDNEHGSLGAGLNATYLGARPGELGVALPFVDLGAGLSVVQLALGDCHACAIVTGGRIKCWGCNEDGQLGYGDTLQRGTTPGDMGGGLPFVPLGSGLTAVQVAAGSRHTCALLSDNATKCWGWNEYGQLGLGDAVPRGIAAGQMGDDLPPLDLGSGRVATALALGTFHTCALLDDGHIKCWGGNGWGQLGAADANLVRGDGLGEMGEDMPPVDLGTDVAHGGKPIMAVALVAAFSHSCAVLWEGSVNCWGTDLVGQLGLGTATGGFGPLGNDLPAVDLGQGESVRALFAQASSNHTCALLTSGAAKCWGANEHGQLGLGDLVNRGDVAGSMGAGLPVVASPLVTSAGAQAALAPGTDHTCVLADGAGVVCWGANDWGQLGLGHGRSTSWPGRAVDLGRAAAAAPVAVHSGNAFSCAVLGDGRCKCWGANEAGQLGAGRNDTSLGARGGQLGDELPYVDLGTGLAVLQLSLGTCHACARVTGSRVKCWGCNDVGQLGYGDTMDRGRTPAGMGGGLPFVALGTNVSALHIEAGAAHTCALLSNNETKCWGWNEYGQLGLGSVGPRGTVRGQMGDALPAVNLGTGRVAVALAAGTWHTCALLDDGTVKCWGNNEWDQLGVFDYLDLSHGDEAGEMGDALAAVDVGSQITVVGLTAGEAHTCVVLARDGGVQCWGRNDLGQLGMGLASIKVSQFSFNNHVDLGGGSAVRGVVAGDNHTCALLTSGAAKCWGRNLEGQLGVGDVSNRGGDVQQMGDALPVLGVPLLSTLVPPPPQPDSPPLPRGTSSPPSPPPPDDAPSSPHSPLSPHTPSHTPPQSLLPAPPPSDASPTPHSPFSPRMPPPQSFVPAPPQSATPPNGPSPPAPGPPPPPDAFGAIRASGQSSGPPMTGLAVGISLAGAAIVALAALAYTCFRRGKNLQRQQGGLTVKISALETVSAIGRKADALQAAEEGGARWGGQLAAKDPMKGKVVAGTGMSAAAVPGVPVIPIAVAIGDGGDNGRATSSEVQSQSSMQPALAILFASISLAKAIVDAGENVVANHQRSQRIMQRVASMLPCLEALQPQLAGAGLSVLEVVEQHLENILQTYTDCKAAVDEWRDCPGGVLGALRNMLRAQEFQNTFLELQDRLTHCHGDLVLALQLCQLLVPTMTAVESEAPSREALEADADADLHRLAQQVMDQGAWRRLTGTERKQAISYYASNSLDLRKLHREARQQLRSEVLKGLRVRWRHLTLMEVIGAGGGGAVHRAMYQRQQVAVKILHADAMTERAQAKAENEAWIMSSLQHPNVAVLKGLVAEHPHYALVMQYYPNGSVLHLLQSEEAPASWLAKVALMMDVVRGLHYLHCRRRPIVHGDLKPSNMLLDHKMRVVLIDFGVARTMASQNTLTMTNPRVSFGMSLAYCAPELLARPSSHPDTRCDMYSLGMVMYEIVTLQPPFSGSTPDLVGQWVATGQRPQLPENVPGPIADLVRQCWAQNPEDRPSAQQVLERLVEMREHLGNIGVMR